MSGRRDEGRRSRDARRASGVDDEANQRGKEV